MSRAAIALLFVLCCSGAVNAHGEHWSQLNPELRNWLRRQQVPPGNGTLSGYPCCDERDGDEVEEDIRENAYWIRGGHFPEWTKVPENLVIKEPNKYGQPLVWFYFVSGKPMIRCFMPGAGI